MLSSQRSSLSSMSAGPQIDRCYGSRWSLGVFQPPYTYSYPSVIIIYLYLSHILLPPDSIWNISIYPSQLYYLYQPEDCLDASKYLLSSCLSSFLYSFLSFIKQTRLSFMPISVFLALCYFYLDLLCPTFPYINPFSCKLHLLPLLSVLDKVFLNMNNSWLA